MSSCLPALLLTCERRPLASRLLAQHHRVKHLTLGHRGHLGGFLDSLCRRARVGVGTLRHCGRRRKPRALRDLCVLELGEHPLRARRVCAPR